MRTLILYGLLAWGMMCCGVVSAQDGFLKKGNEAYAEQAFVKATRYYEKYLAKNFKKEAVENLADSYRRLSQYEDAALWYEKLIKLKQVDSETYLRYGQMLISTQNYPEAQKWLSKFIELNPDDPRGKLFLADALNPAALYDDSAHYALRTIKINTREAEFSPVLYEDGIVFTSSRPRYINSERFEYNDQPFLDLWFCKMEGEGKKFGRPRLFRDVVNSKMHDATACFNREGNEIFFTRNNVEGAKKAAGDDELLNLKIYYGDVANDGWKNLKSLPFNAETYSVGHPSLSWDGKTLFFISDMPGGFGGTDIYFSLRQGDSWSDPVNLGPEINTAGNEMFPFIHESGRLWFSSDGQGGLGGLDIYYASFDSVWGNVKNPGAPLNSNADDFSVMLNPFGTFGMLASGRKGGKGSDDLYFFEVNRPVMEAVIAGVLDTLPVEGAKIHLKNLTNNTETVLESGESGRLVAWLQRDNEYEMRATRSGYLPYQIKFNTNGFSDTDKMRDTFWMEQPPLFLVGRVRERETQLPVVDASVQVMYENTWMTTNEGGFFSLHMDARLKDDFDWDKLENPNCYRQMDVGLCFRFFEEGTQHTDSTVFKYVWNLGDGTTVESTEAEHCFAGPGQYLIELNMVDVLTNEVAFNEVTYLLEIPDPGRGYIISSDTARVGQEVQFSCDKESLKDCEISSYRWDFGDGTVVEGQEVAHSWKVPGKYDVKLELTKANLESSDACENCIFKTVEVFPPDISADSIRKLRPTVFLDGRKDYFFRVTRKGYVPVMVPWKASRLTGTDTLEVNISLIPDRVMLRGVALDYKTHEPLRNLEFRLVDANTGEVESVQESPDGNFSFPVKPETDYILETRKDGFLTQKVPVRVDDPSKTPNGGNPNDPAKGRDVVVQTDIQVELEPAEIGKTFVLKEIYFDFDKAFIRPDAQRELDKVVEFMRDNPTVMIEFSAHTDSRGDDSYNLELSQRRAVAARAYILAQGVPATHVTAKGYGEQRLVNPCKNGIACAEEFHQQNRRCEFAITGLSQPMYSKATPVLEMKGDFKEGGFLLKELMGEQGVSASPNKTVSEKRFSILLGVYASEPEQQLMEKLREYENALFKEPVSGGTRYRVGNIQSMETAERHLEKLQKRGFQDAAIIEVGGVETPGPSKSVVAGNGGDVRSEEGQKAKPSVSQEIHPKGPPYLIQIAAVKGDLDDKFYFALEGFMNKIVTEPKGNLTRYRIGPYQTLSEAETALVELQKRGFSDAYIVD